MRANTGAGEVTGLTTVVRTGGDHSEGRLVCLHTATVTSLLL